jgi:DNA-binding response OmpR family regulator
MTILVVEDDEATAELVRTLLNREAGWGATVVHDAAAAREVFRHIQVELLVLDVNLPGISGVELLDLLRRDPHWREPPVILMSAYPEQPQIQQVLDREPTIRLLAKPFDVDELVEAVRQAATRSPPAGVNAGRAAPAVK